MADEGRDVLNWVLSVALAVSIIIVSVCLRLMASMKTSNSSRHRIGHPTASQNESSSATVLNDFSPPDSWFGSLSFARESPPARSSVWICAGWVRSSQPPLARFHRRSRLTLTFSKPLT